MLTATYAINLILIERKQARMMLTCLEKNIKNCEWIPEQKIKTEHVKKIVYGLKQFFHYCHRRKLETHIIPAIHKLNSKIDSLFAELDFLSEQAWGVITSLERKVETVSDRSIVTTDCLYFSLMHYCQKLTCRLSKEENELLPKITTYLTSENWFSIAIACLSEQSKAGKPLKNLSPPGVNNMVSARNYTSQKIERTS